MTTLPSHRRTARIGLNLTAMIDVVFLLLLYFMAATEFKVGEEIYRLDLPQRAPPADPFRLPREPLRITVASFGPHYTIRLSDTHIQPESFQDLYVYLHEKRVTEMASEGTYEADYPIIIEPTAATRWEHAMEAFNAAARARYTNITFAPPRGG